MAALTFDTSSIADILLKNYGATIVEGFSRQGPGNRLVASDSIHGRLREKGRVFLDGADSNDRYAREWSTHHAGSSADSFTASTAFPVASSESYDQAQIEWKRIGVSLEYDNLLVMSKGTARGGASVIALDFESKLKELISELAIQLAASGSGNDVKGFGDFLAATGTYANIAQTNTYWKPVLTAAASAALAKSHFETTLQTMHNTNGGVGPNVEIWMNLVQWNNYRSLFVDSLRYAPGDSTSEKMAGVWADGQFELPIFVIKDLPTDEVWIVDTDCMELRFKTNTPAAELADMADKNVSHEGVPIMLQPVSKAQDVRAIFMKMYPALVCLNPWKLGAITGLSTS